MTQQFYSYKKGTQVEYAKGEPKKHPVVYVGIVIAAVVLVATTLVIDSNFDRFFPYKYDVKIIAHRGGGSVGAENTVDGIEAAYNMGAYGSEIDVQRTRDGAYILLHDGDFKRVAGDDRKPTEMTLAEIRKLSVDGEPVPTFEEALLACKGKVVLFTELKGGTADTKMADDLVEIVKKHGMEKECVFISLKFDVIDHIEAEHPEILTAVS